MNDTQSPGLDKDNSLPASDEQSREQNESSPKSYYYDDATGYEIYKEQSNDDDEAKTS